MARQPTVGTTIDYGPIPIVEAETTFVPAGVIEIGIASRVVDWQAVQRLFTEEAGGASARRAEIEANAQARADDPPGGVAIHVRDAASKAEYLRFDCFDDGPHYHYIEEPGHRQTVVTYDVAANGPVLEWAYDRIHRHLPAMLTHIGRDDVAAQLDPVVLAEALDVVRQVASDVDSSLRSVAP